MTGPAPSNPTTAGRLARVVAVSDAKHAVLAHVMREQDRGAGRGGEGYLPGNGLGQAFALGLAAGEEIASIHLRA